MLNQAFAGFAWFLISCLWSNVAGIFSPSSCFSGCVGDPDRLNTRDISIIVGRVGMSSNYATFIHPLYQRTRIRSCYADMSYSQGPLNDDMLRENRRLFCDGSIMERQLCVCVRKDENEIFYLTVKKRQPGWALVACLENLDQGDHFLFLPVSSDEEAQEMSAQDIRSDKRSVEAHVTRRAEPGNYHLRLNEGKILHKVERLRSGSRQAEELKVDVSSAGPITTLDV